MLLQRHITYSLYVYIYLLTQDTVGMGNWVVYYKTPSSSSCTAKSLHAEPGEVVVCGRRFEKITDPDLEELLRAKTWFSYRKGFALPKSDGKTKFKSDAGWGCVHRCGQMMLINTLARHLQTEENALVPLFMDVESSPFSILAIAGEGVPLGKKVGQWFSPGIVARCIQSLVKKQQSEGKVLHEKPLDVIIPVDGCIYPEYLHSRLDQYSGILLLMPIRLGLNTVCGQYHYAIRSCLGSHFSVGIIGGKPKHSLYFIGYKGRHLISMDPHKVQTAFVSLDTAGATDDQKRSVPIPDMDPSCLISFLVTSHDAIDELTAQLVDLVQESRYPLFSILEGTPLTEDELAKSVLCLDDDDDSQVDLDDSFVIV